MTKNLEAKIDTIGAHADTLEAGAFLSTADTLQLLRMIRDTADSALDNAVTLARAEGMTWDEVGRWIGLTRQGAQQRWG